MLIIEARRGDQTVADRSTGEAIAALRDHSAVGKVVVTLD